MTGSCVPSNPGSPTHVALLNGINCGGSPTSSIVCGGYSGGYCPEVP